MDCRLQLPGGKLKEKEKGPGLTARHEGNKAWRSRRRTERGCRNPRNCTFSMGGTLRGRFELPRALRPTRSQVWRVGPGFATSANAPSRGPAKYLLSSFGGRPQGSHVQLEGDDRLHERVDLEDPRMDLAKPSDVPPVEDDGRGSARDEIRVVDRGHLPRLPEVAQEAQDQGLRLRERCFVVHRRAGDPPRSEERRVGKECRSR